MLTRKTLTFLVPITAAAALASLGGCELIASVDRTKIDAGTGGSATTSTGGMGGTPSTGGGGMMCTDANCVDDTPDDCSSVGCVDGACTTGNEPVRELCVDDDKPEANICDGEGDCVECIDTTDCEDNPATPNCSTSGTCVPAQCVNGMLDGDETDTDCGGSMCDPCANTLGCVVAGDCESNFCDMSGGGPGGAGGGPATGVCTPCGGNGDCATVEYCDTGDDGGTCVPDEADGFDCSTFGADSCTSGNCADGVCCDTACGSTCEACTMVKTGMADGTCANVMATTDPDMECPGTTSCDGSGACALLADGMVCSLSNGSECTSNNCVDGFCCGTTCGGSCVSCGLSGSEGTCTPYMNGQDPESECVGNTSCDGSGSCALFGNGTVCTLTNGNECTSGNCVDGFCCNAGTCGTCESCGVTGQEGLCNNVMQLSQDPGTCDGAADACDGSGSCKLTNGETCAGNGDCASDNCGGLGGGGGAPMGTCQ